MWWKKLRTRVEEISMYDQSSLACIMLQSLPLPYRWNHLLYTDKYINTHTLTQRHRKQIPVAQWAGTPFDLQRFLSCKILNIYGLQLKPAHAQPNRKIEAERFSFPN